MVLSQGDVSIVNLEEATTLRADDEDVQKVRNKISDIGDELQSILYNARLSMGDTIAKEKLVQINNVVQELEKATINLGTAVNIRDEEMPAE